MESSSSQHSLLQDVDGASRAVLGFGNLLRQQLVPEDRSKEGTDLDSGDFDDIVLLGSNDACDIGASKQMEILPLARRVPVSLACRTPFLSV